MIISQDTCPPPQECLDNWDPSPCTSCQITCGPCTIYTYCGSSRTNSECNLYVGCTENAFVRIHPIEDINIPFFASFIEDCTYQSWGVAKLPTNNGPVNYNGTLVINVTIDGIITRCSTPYNCN